MAFSAPTTSALSGGTPGVGPPRQASSPLILKLPGRRPDERPDGAEPEVSVEALFGFIALAGIALGARAGFEKMTRGTFPHRTKASCRG